MIFTEAGANNHIVCTSGIIYAKRRAATIDGDQIRKGVANTFRLGCRTRHASPIFFRMCHKHTEVPTIADRNVVKHILAARSHKDAQIISRQHRFANNIVIKSKIQRNSRAGVIVQLQFRKQTLSSEVTGKTVEFIVKCLQIAHRQPSLPKRRNHATGTAS